MKPFDLLEATLNNELLNGDSWQDELNAWHWLEQGVLLVAPLNNEPCERSIVLSCGIHGNETAPIELLVAILKSLSAKPQRLQARVLFILGNPAAVVQKDRFVDENLNRLFTQLQKNKEPENPEQQRAIRLMQLVDQFFQQSEANQCRLHYDLHTAIRDSQHPFFAVYPYDRQGFKRDAIGRLQAAHVDTFLLSHAPATTFSHYSHAYHQAEAFTVELGKVKPFGDNDMVKLEPLKQLLEQMLFDDWPEPDIVSTKLKLFTVTRAVPRNHAEFDLAFDDKLANFTQFDKGQLLACDGDKKVVAEHQGEAVVFPNRNVAIGQRALLTVIQADDSILIKTK